MNVADLVNLRHTLGDETANEGDITWRICSIGYNCIENAARIGVDSTPNSWIWAEVQNGVGIGGRGDVVTAVDITMCEAATRLGRSRGMAA